MRIIKVEYKGIGVQKFSMPSNSEFAFGIKATDELPYSAITKDGAELSALSETVNGYTVYQDRTGEVGTQNYTAKLIGLETRPVATPARLFNCYTRRQADRYITFGLPITDDNFWDASNPPAGPFTLYPGEYVSESGTHHKMTSASMSLKNGSSASYNDYQISYYLEGVSARQTNELLFLKKAVLPADVNFIDFNSTPGAGWESFPSGYTPSWEDAPNCVGADHSFTFFQRTAYLGEGTIDVPTQVQVVKNEVPIEVRSVANPYMYVDFTEAQ